MSGAAVFADSLLLGLVVDAPIGFGGSRLEVVPVSALVSQAGFRAAYEASGSVDVGLYAIDDDRSAAVEHQDPGKPDDAGDDASATGRRSSGDSADGLADQVDWVSDSPATNDLLGRRHLAQALAHRLRRLRQQDPGSSYLIHVDGSWGSGKSTLVELLARSLGSEFLVVRFDAWRQSLVGPPWWALLTSLRRTLAADASFVTRLSLRLSEAGQRVRRGGLPYLIGLAALLAAVAGLLVLFKPQVAPKAAGEFATSLSAVFAAVGTLWFGTRLLGKLLFWDSATGAKLFEQSDENPTESLAEHFAWLLVRARRPVMFVIDDLDRCGHDYVVDLLDAVQTLIRDVPRRQHRATAGALVAPYFVVAADGAWIRRSYEVRHEQFKDAVAVPGRPLGYLFLDKIFQLTLEIPSIGWAAQRAYLEQLLGGTQSGSMDMGRLAATTVEEINRSTSESDVLDALERARPDVRGRVAGTAIDKLSQADIETSIEHALQKFAPLLEPNPRAIKRFVNAYGLARACSVLGGTVIPRDALALWTILRLRWPGLADYLRCSPSSIEALARGDGAVSAVPDDLQVLFTDPSVVRVAGFPHGGPLTAEHVQLCCGGIDPPNSPVPDPSG